MAYGVVRTDKMFGTDNRAGLVSLKFMNGTGASAAAAAIENGNVALLGDLATGEREVYLATQPAANSALQNVVLVASPEVMYDERKHTLGEFINEAGKIARGYYFHNEDIFSVTADALTNGKAASAAIAVGDVVELQAGTKLKVVASLTSGSTQVGKIIAIDTVGTMTYYAIQVKEA